MCFVVTVVVNVMVVRINGVDDSWSGDIGVLLLLLLLLLVMVVVVMVMVLAFLFEVVQSITAGAAGIVVPAAVPFVMMWLSGRNPDRVGCKLKYKRSINDFTSWSFNSSLRSIEKKKLHHMSWHNFKLTLYFFFLRQSLDEIPWEHDTLHQFVSFNKSLSNVTNVSKGSATFRVYIFTPCVSCI